MATRREFLKNVGLGTSALTGLGLSRKTEKLENRENYNISEMIPAHLPRRLAICEWQWAWLTHAFYDEPYGQLRKVMQGMRERGYNTIRVDIGLDLCFDMQGNPRDEVEFMEQVPGYCSKIRVRDCRGGVRYKVLDRVLELFTLCREYGIFVIVTSWEYQTTSYLLKDSSLREEILNLPIEKRLMNLAYQHDRLLNVLKEKGLEKNIAFTEIHNEVNYSDFLQEAEGMKLHEEAIAYLRERHPDILISGDMGGPKVIQYVPDNSQVLDIHVYFGSIMYMENLYNKTVRHPEFDPRNPIKNPLLQKLLRDDYVPYNIFSKDVPYLTPKLIGRLWLTYNVDARKFDQYMLEKFDEYIDGMKKSAVRNLTLCADEGKKRNLPVVLDEGGYFSGPAESRWEESDKSLEYLDFVTDLAIKNEYWGFLPTTYNGPDMPLWHERSEWIRENCNRFISSAMKHQ